MKDEKWLMLMALQLSLTVIHKKALSSVKKVLCLKKSERMQDMISKCFLVQKYFLELWVKVQKDWRNKPPSEGIRI